MKSRLSVVIVTHEHKRYIQQCIDSILRQNEGHIEVVVVDNASRDGTANYIRRVFPDAHLIEQKQRYGFSANVNVGIRKTKGEYVMILNPDTVLLPDAFSILARFMEAHPRVGICGPRLINADGSTQMSYRNFPTWKTALFRRTPIRWWFHSSSVVRQHLNIGKDHKSAQQVDWMLGACLLFRRSTLDAIGYFDESYRLYVEDIDICLRAHVAGWEVWYVPEATVMHRHEAVSDRTFMSWHFLFHTVSMLQYVKKHWKFMIGRRI